MLLIRFPSPAYTWAQVKAWEWMRQPGLREGASFLSSLLPAGLDRQRWEGVRTGPGGRRRPRLASSAFVAAAPGSPAPSLRQPRPHKS